MYRLLRRSQRMRCAHRFAYHASDLLACFSIFHDPLFKIREAVLALKNLRYLYRSIQELSDYFIGLAPVN